MIEILKRDGLSVDILRELSYHSQLGISLKNNLHYFDKEKLFRELVDVKDWYESCDMLHELALDYRVKSLQSAMLKYHRYYPDCQARKVFDDLLGFRSLCDDYQEIQDLQGIPNFRLADMSAGKAIDDGYRGIHVYFQLNNSYYPIELQYNSFYDRQFNDWLHKYLYKKSVAPDVGAELRRMYESAKIRNETDFKEMMNYVLSGGKTY